MLISLILSCGLVLAEPPTNGIKPSNIIGGADQHASFSFIRPGLTQTSYSFNGPSSHQAFSSSIGNPALAQRVLPNVAQALAYRNPGLGHFSTGPIASAYATPQHHVYQGQQQQIASSPFAYQQQPQFDPSLLANYYQAQQQQQHQFGQNHQIQPQNEPYQTSLNQLLALRQAQLQQLHQSLGQAQLQSQREQATEQQRTAEQEQQQQPAQQTQNLLGVAYSAAPSVAHVKVSGNGYKFDF